MAPISPGRSPSSIRTIRTRRIRPLRRSSCRLPSSPAARSRSTSRSPHNCPRSSRERGSRTTSTWSASGSRRSACMSRRGCAAARRAAGTATSSTPTRSSTRTTASTTSRSRRPPASRWPPRASARQNTAIPTAPRPTPTNRATFTTSPGRPIPHYLVIKDTFSATRDVTPAEYEQTSRLLGRTLDEVKLTDVDITVMLQPGHAPQASRHVQAAKASLKWFGLWYGRYPYKTLVVVDPAAGAAGAGGMEYPTFITAGTTWLSNRWPFDKLRLAEFVTVHEFGHQYLVRDGRQQRVRGGLARRGHQLVLDRPGGGPGLQVPDRRAELPGVRNGHVAGDQRSRCALQRHRGEGLGLSAAGMVRVLLVPEAGARVADARGVPRRRDDGARDADVPRTVEVPSPVEPGLLRRDQRSDGPELRLVLEPGVQGHRRARLRGGLGDQRGRERGTRRHRHAEGP